MEAFALCDYWRRCLADVDLRSPDLRGAQFPLQPAEIEQGSLLPETTVRIFEATAPKGHDNDERTTVALLIAPFALRRWFHHGTPRNADTRIFHPLWIPARLSRAGALTGTKITPWIGRQFLEPVFRDSPLLGRLEDLERFLTREIVEDSDWAKTLDYSERMLEAVTGKRLATLELEELEILPPVAVPWNEERGVARSILALYDRILELEAPPPLLRTLAEGARPTTAPPPYSLEDPGAALRHLGQMSDAFPLSPSQRQALHGLLSLEEGSLLAVNGPPGTGKTTLLQSVVASLWVRAALDQAEPPIVVACSTNNQAVTNILDSFAATASPAGDSLFSERWLPALTSYGLYLPSQGKLGTSRYQAAAPGRPQWQGLPEEMENPKYLAKAQDHYLGRARQALGPACPTVEDVVRTLHEKMTALQSRMEKPIAEARVIAASRQKQGLSSQEAAHRFIEAEENRRSVVAQEQEALHKDVLEAFASLSFLEDLLSFLPPIRRRRELKISLPFRRRQLQPPPMEGLLEALAASLQEARAHLGEIRQWQKAEEQWSIRLRELGASCQDEPEKVLDPLDRLRHQLFLLAGRYWEGRWLLEMSRLIRSGDKLHAKSRGACEARLRRFSMLTPCMVATFYQAARAFRYWDPESGKEIPLFSTLDLLIVDEAGQASPEVGSAAFALAKRALVVGDIHQIEPVASLLPAVDAANLRASGIKPAPDDTEEAVAFRSSWGSVMLQARCASALTREGVRGLLLTEHRRSVPEVIRYCNELVYGGQLRALRPPLKNRVLPPLGWAHVTSIAASDGGSRVNPGEAQAIADWLARHQRELEKHYGGSLGEIVAVITPFVAQKGALEAAFREQSLPNVQAGTVHTFQGAERPVVLFSPVYSLAEAPKTLFFDSGPSLLNVAVSRAKDSFLVFGDLRLFDSEKVTLPSGKLASLLFESPENEITDVESAQHLKRQAGVRRIATLEDHRAALRRALEEARKRLLIVSPYLSINALEADQVPDAVATSRSRGTQVCVVFSRDLSSPQYARTQKAIAALEQAGAEVKALRRIHSKTLAVDESWMVEGSFNWLSASRDKENLFQRHEASFLVEGPSARKTIDDAWRELDQIRS